MKKKNIAFLAILMTALMTGCSNLKSTDSTANNNSENDLATVTENNNEEAEKEAENMETATNRNDSETEVIEIGVTSESLTPDGKWLTVINNTTASPKGSNLSPQLNWDKVDGAACYAIYMVDNSAIYWIHWIAKNVTVNELSLGEELDNSRYIGPYPPSGTHEYEVIVYALKQSPENYPGAFDNNLVPIKTIEKQLDTVNEIPGNIIGKGSITGTVTVGEVVE